MMLHFNLYHTLGCHLCEDAEALIIPIFQQLFQQYRCTYEKIDIADSYELIAEYGIRIPVLKNNDDGTELAWPFDRELLIQFIGNEIGEK